MALEQRLRRIEIRLNLQAKKIDEPGFLNLLDLPKETVIGAFAILKEAAGGYHCVLQQGRIESVNSDGHVALNQLTPEQLYDLVVQHESRIPEAKR